MILIEVTTRRDKSREAARVRSYLVAVRACEQCAPANELLCVRARVLGFFARTELLGAGRFALDTEGFVRFFYFVGGLDNTLGIVDAL